MYVLTKSDYRLKKVFFDNPTRLNYHICSPHRKPISNSDRAHQTHNLKRGVTLECTYGAGESTHIIPDCFLPTICLLEHEMSESLVFRPHFNAWRPFTLGPTEDTTRGLLCSWSLDLQYGSILFN